VSGVILKSEWKNNFGVLASYVAKLFFHLSLLQSISNSDSEISYFHINFKYLIIIMHILNNNTFLQKNAV